MMDLYKFYPWILRRGLAFSTVLLMLAALFAQAPVVAMNTKSSVEFPLIEAVLNGNGDDLVELLASGIAPDSEEQGQLGMTPLMAAASKNNVEMAKLLIEAGADIDKPDRFGDPAINWAAYYGNAELLNHLLKLNANTMLLGHGNTYQILIRRGFDKLARAVVEHEGHTIKLEENDARLAEAIATNNHAQAKHAIANGAKASGTDKHGFSHLNQAVKLADLKIVELLVKSGANISHQDNVGFTPLSYAAREGRSDIVTFLLEQGADIEHAGNAHSLHMTPLQLAATAGEVAMVELLVNKGANVNNYNNVGGSAFTWAISEKQEEATIKLLSLGANPLLIGFESTEQIIDYSKGQKMEKLAAYIEAM